MTVPTEWIEGLEKLRSMPRPVAVNLRLWQHVVEAAGYFMEDWSTRAAALGWDTAAIFGCSASAPMDRLDLAGLVWFLDIGDEIAAMSETTAVIRKRSGATQTFRRTRPFEPVICTWDLGEDSPTEGRKSRESKDPLLKRDL